jgi:hypothetical protein
VDPHVVIATESPENAFAKEDLLEELALTAMEESAPLVTILV